MSTDAATSVETAINAEAPARQPTPEQAAAIGARAGDVLLEAGAGTGKTGVMVDRYCRLVAAFTNRDRGRWPPGS